MPAGTEWAAQTNEWIVVEDSSYDSDGIVTPPLPPERARRPALPSNRNNLFDSQASHKSMHGECLTAASPQDQLCSTQQAASSPSSMHASRPTPDAEGCSAVPMDERSPGRSPNVFELSSDSDEEKWERPRKRRGVPRKVKRTRARTSSAVQAHQAGPSQSLRGVYDPAVPETGITQARHRPDPVPLVPDFVFEPPDESLFDELKAFLDEQEQEDIFSSNVEEHVKANVTEEEYKQQRLRKLRANEAILAKLGLAPSPLSPSSAGEREEDVSAVSSQQAFTKRSALGRPEKGQRALKLDADGTTTSLPLPGCTTEVAYVDVPALRNRIRLRHLYFEDVEAAVAGPSRPTGTEAVGDDMTDREEQPPLKEPGTRRQSQRGAFGEAMAGNHTTCHQCRRKTEEEKMRCRYHEGGMVCRLYWCRRCLDTRYGIEWDPESRMFECPRCTGYCNCSLCLHRAGLSRFVPHSIYAGLSSKLQDKGGSKKCASARHYLEAKVGRAVRTGPGGLQAPHKAAKQARMAEREAKREKKMAGKAERQSLKAAERAEMKAEAGRMRAERKMEKERTRNALQANKKGKKGAKQGTTLRRAKRQPGAVAQAERRGINKIKLTWKGRESHKHADMGQRVARSEADGRSKKPKKASKHVDAAARIPVPPSLSGIETPKKAEDLNVWVRSKADAFDTSSSNSEDSTVSNLLGRHSNTPCFLEGDHEQEEGDEEDGPTDETWDEPSVPPLSPEAGEVERSFHPKLLVTGNYDSSTDEPYACHSSDASHSALGNLVNVFPHHDGHDVAAVLDQLRASGYL